MNRDTVGLQTPFRAQNNLSSKSAHKAEAGFHRCLSIPREPLRALEATLGTTASLHLGPFCVTLLPREGEKEKHKPFLFSPLDSPNLVKSPDSVVRRRPTQTLPFFQLLEQSLDDVLPSSGKQSSVGRIGLTISLEIRNSWRSLVRSPGDEAHRGWPIGDSQGRGVPGFPAKILAPSCSHTPSHSLPIVPPTGICLPSWLSLLLLTRLFSLDNDIVCRLEQVTAALACEGQIGKVRAGPRGAKT